MVRICDIPLNIEFDERRLMDVVTKIIGVNSMYVKDLHIVKKSLDARRKQDIHFNYTVDFCLTDVDEGQLVQKFDNPRIHLSKPYNYELLISKSFKHRPVVIGSGPGGLFAALILAECGSEPIVIERGKPVEERKTDVDDFFSGGPLNVQSNVQFGEGGAGTFSDGKLTTGIHDKRINKVLGEFVLSGAPEEIMYLSKPHIGTDNLINVVKSLRNKIISLGGEFLFETAVTNLNIKNNKITGVTVQKGGNEAYDIETGHIVLAIGHSARDTVEMLHRKEVMLEQKPFSVGVRIEHDQRMIDRGQYGALASNKHLPPAEYKLSVQTMDKRGAYTFCMCPGGTVVAAASEEGALVTNGMSNFARNGSNANSALLVGVMPHDFGDSHPLAGIYYQRSLEKIAFKAGGGDYKAPAQLVGDFMANKPTTEFRSVTPSYPRGVVPGNLNGCLPQYITDVLRFAIREMNMRVQGFGANDAVLTGVETRSSSPVRILRDRTMQSNIRGLYPCGEGAGYAGGIMSSAVDGIKCAESILGVLEE